MMKAQWYAADLEEHSERRELGILSVHDHVVNFVVKGWPQLLMVADQSLEKGPATIGLSGTDFRAFYKMARTFTAGSYEPGAVTVDSKNREEPLTINWREGKTVSFAPPGINNLDFKLLITAVESYRRMLGKMRMPTAAAVLLGMTGGDEYFRSEFMLNFPPLAESLLKKDDQRFLSSCHRMIGMGRGSSPGGDDLISGALVAFNYFYYDRLFLERIKNGLAELVEQTNLMGRHMLETGRKGLASEPVRTFMLSFVQGNPEYATLKKVLQVGSYTGYELAIASIYFINELTGQTNTF